MLVSQLLLTLCNPCAAHQASLSLEFSRQECSNGFPCPPLGIFSTQDWTWSPTLQVDSLPPEPPEKACKTNSSRIKLYALELLCLVWLFCNPRTVAHQAPLFMEFPRQEHRNWLTFPSPGESSWPRDQTWVSCIGRQILYHWATREALGSRVL